MENNIEVPLKTNPAPTSVELRKDAQWHVTCASSIDTIDINHFTNTDNCKIQQNN